MAGRGTRRSPGKRRGPGDEPRGLRRGVGRAGADAQPGLVRDCETLLAARAALFGELLVNWGSGTQLTLGGCDRRRCAAAGHRVGLRDRDGGLTPGSPATIPAALGALDHLQRLDLAATRSGPSRRSWAPPPDRTVARHERVDRAHPGGTRATDQPHRLDLGYNRLGEIPRALVCKPSVLSRSDNRLTGCIPSGLRRVERHDLAELGLPDCEAGS